MINKEEIGMETEAIKWLSSLEIKSEYEATNKEILLNYIDKLKEVNIENSKLISRIDIENYKLKDRIKELEEICKGKSIQEMGTSNLYKED